MIVLNLSENLTTEFKEAYTDDIKKTVVAFANTAGGRFISTLLTTAAFAAREHG